MKFKVGDLVGNPYSNDPSRMVYKIDIKNRLYYFKYRIRGEWIEIDRPRLADQFDSMLVRKNHHDTKLGKILYKDIS